MADKSIMSYETVALDDEKSALVILDQTKLPYEVEILSLTDQKDIWNLKGEKQRFVTESISRQNRGRKRQKITFVRRNRHRRFTTAT